MMEDSGVSVLMEVEELETAVMRTHLALQQFIRERKRDKEFDVDELPVGGVVSLSFSLLPEVRRQLKLIRNWLKKTKIIKMEIEQGEEGEADYSVVVPEDEGEEEDSPEQNLHYSINSHTLLTVVNPREYQEDPDYNPYPHPPTTTTPSSSSTSSVRHRRKQNSNAAGDRDGEGSLILPEGAKSRSRRQSYKPRNKPSKAHQFFEDQGDFHVCTLCGVKYKKSGGSTTGLLRHLKSKHSGFEEGHDHSEEDSAPNKKAKTDSSLGLEIEDPPHPVGVEDIL